MYYESYFELREAPFSISPDPRYLYLTQNHREALAHLLYGVSSNGGFVLLTGEIGAGKTTVCQCLLEQLPDNTDVAYILNPKLEPWEFFATICDELGIEYEDGDTSLKHYIDLIHRYLLDAHARGRNTVLMVDEAQNLSTEMIEHLRLLTNLETAEKKLLQIMLVGQPELRDKIALPEMRQMAQRITARYHLGPLTRSEVGAYVRHRLNVGGAKRDLFSQDCLNRLWRLTGGVPRLINMICDRAMLGTYTSKRHRVERDVLDDAAAEVLGRRMKSPASLAGPLLWGALAILLGAVAFGAAYYYRSVPPVTVPPRPAPVDNLETGVALSDDVVSSSLQQESAAPDNGGGILGETVVEVDPPIQPIETISETPAERPPEVEAAEPDIGPDAETVEEAPSEMIEPQAFSLDFPAGLSRDALELSAYSALFDRWGIAYRPVAGVDPCRFAGTQGLICLEGQGNLPMLLQLNRPALLTLYDRQGKNYAATLVRAGASEAGLILAGRATTVPVSELSRWWYGEYQILWQPPPGYSRPLQKGAAGPAVVWLLQQLGEKIASDNPRFDDAIEQRVKRFQRDNGLVPDGVVGPRTVIALNNRTDKGLPRLTQSAKE